MNLTLYQGTFYSMSCFELKLNKVEEVEWLYVESRDKATDNTGGGEFYSEKIGELSSFSMSLADFSKVSGNADSK